MYVDVYVDMCDGYKCGMYDECGCVSDVCVMYTCMMYGCGYGCVCGYVCIGALMV